MPFGSLVAHPLIDAGILAPGTPEARAGLARGELMGGILGLLWAGGGKAPSAAPVQALRPVPATAGGGAGVSPPLVVLPSAIGMLAGAGGAVSIAVAAAELSVALSQGSGGDKHHIATDKNKVAGQRWTEKFDRLFQRAGASLDDARNKVVVAGHKGPHPDQYHEIVYRRLDDATDRLAGDAARDAHLNELDSLVKEIATPGTELNKLVTKVP